MLSLIVAASDNFAIGKDNQLLWHLPNDLKFFKRTTSGRSIIMGRKTYESLGKALPNRQNIVVSRQADLELFDAKVFSSLEEAIAFCKEEEEVFIIGGAEIYKQSLHLVDKIYITKVHHEFDADAYFPEVDFSAWKVIFEEHHQKDEKHAFPYSFFIYEKP